VQLSRPADADSFLARAGDFLLEREAEHNLILGLAGRLRERPRFYGDHPYFAVLEDGGGRVVGAALRTPPHNLVVSEIDDMDALEPLAADARATYATLPGVLGPKAVAAEFARLWQAATGAAGRVAVAERIYRAAQASPPEGVPGRLRAYADADYPLVLDWFAAFFAEAAAHVVVEGPRAILDRRLDDPDCGLVLWDDGGAVSLAGYGSPTASGIRSGPVYTPPGLRGRGYASALVGGLTRDLLGGGSRFCFLYTDLANPTSNSIYRKVGYEPVSDVDEWAFAP
jgi:predicted GNAT family acetyltransferase